MPCGGFAPARTFGAHAGHDFAQRLADTRDARRRAHVHHRVSPERLHGLARACVPTGRRRGLAEGDRRRSAARAMEQAVVTAHRHGAHGRGPCLVVRDVVSRDGAAPEVTWPRSRASRYSPRGAWDREHSAPRDDRGDRGQSDLRTRREVLHREARPASRGESRRAAWPRVADGAAPRAVRREIVDARGRARVRVHVPDRAEAAVLQAHGRDRARAPRGRARRRPIAASACSARPCARAATGADSSGCSCSRARSAVVLRSEARLPDGYSRRRRRSPGARCLSATARRTAAFTRSSPSGLAQPAPMPLRRADLVVPRSCRGDVACSRRRALAEHDEPLRDAVAGRAVGPVFRREARVVDAAMRAFARFAVPAVQFATRPPDDRRQVERVAEVEHVGRAATLHRARRLTGDVRVPRR